MGFEHTPWSIGADFAEFRGDKNVDRARNTGKDVSRGFDRIEIEAECLGANLSYEPICFIVHHFFSMAVVCRRACVMECIVTCFRVGEIESSEDKHEKLGKQLGLLRRELCFALRPFGDKRRRSDGVKNRGAFHLSRDVTGTTIC